FQMRLILGFVLLAMHVAIALDDTKCDSVVLAEIEQRINGRNSEELMRRRMIDLPEEAIKDFIAGDYYKFPFNDDKFDGALGLYKKWNLTKDFYERYLDITLKWKKWTRLQASSLHETEDHKAWFAAQGAPN
ncbi:hypothetical protein PMAYCL1PPCAC_09465, partial [Pristionchus mayeri]